MLCLLGHRIVPIFRLHQLASCTSFLGIVDSMIACTCLARQLKDDSAQIPACISDMTDRC